MEPDIPICTYSQYTALDMHEDKILQEIEMILHVRDNWACRKSFNLLYSARKLGKCDPKDFHEICDNKSGTVTILFGNNGVIFGGYAKEDWSITKEKYKKDDSAFLFRKYPLQGKSFETFTLMENQERWALYCHEDYGPCFGGGYYTACDLMAFHKSWFGLCSLQNGIFKLNGTSRIQSGVFKNYGTNLGGNGPMEVTDVRVYQVEVNKNPVWRNIPTEETEIQDLKKKIEGLSLKNELGINHLNILLIGSSRAGKSSFCNTLSAVLTDKMNRIAETGSEKSSVTNKLHCYKLVCRTNDQLEIHVTDIRGYEENRGYDFELDKILDGKLKPGYCFDDTEKKVTESDLEYLTKRENAIHVVCFVVDVNQEHSQRMRQQFQTIKKRIRQRDLPVIGIATKLDIFCQGLEQNLEHIYQSTKCEYAVKDVALNLEIQANAVFPIVNYTDDEYFHEKKNLLALVALHCILEKTIVHIKELKEWKELHDDKDIWYTRNEEVLKLTEPPFKNKLMQSIKKDDNLRILCVGKPNAGKSAFIDSILSTASGSISNRATGGFTRSKTDVVSIPVTEIFISHKLKLGIDEKGLQNTRLYFCDMPGIHEKNKINVEHVKYIIDGQVPSRCEILAGINEDKDFVKEPEKAHKIHLVCFVVDGSNADAIEEWEVHFFKQLKMFLLRRGISFVTVVTKIDLLDEKLGLDCEIPYMKICLQRCLQKIEDKFGLRRSVVFPVRNYIHEQRLHPSTDALLCDVLRQIVRLAKQSKDVMDEDSA